MYVYMCSYVRSKKTQCYTERVPCNSLDTAVHEGRIPVSHPWAELLITQFCFNESDIRFAPPLFHAHIHVLYIMMLHNVNEKTKNTAWVTFEVKSMTPTKSTFLPDTYTPYALQTEWIIETI